MRKLVYLLLISLATANVVAQSSSSQHFSSEVKKYIVVDESSFALTHVRIIDGTGAAAADDQTIVVVNGKISKVGKSNAISIPAGTRTIDKSGYTVIPGLVGMHNHLYYTASIHSDEEGHLYSPGFFINEVPFTAPRLYLACGVTTMRTTGSVEPYTDFNVKKDIDSGDMPGPKIDLSAPYLEGAPGGASIPQLHELTGPEDARHMVDFWADQGFTSYKAYMHIKAADIKAAIDEAHKRGAKITGHLCSVGYRQAAELGIDDLEHGFFVNGDFAANKKPDECPSSKDVSEGLMKIDPNGSDAQSLYKFLIDHHVAVTSTLPVFEASTGANPVSRRMLDSMAPEARSSYLSIRAQSPKAYRDLESALLKKDMEMEHAFVKAGGMLLAGPDPTGNGGTLPGFADQREVELLVTAGFAPVEAIKIATSNGAQFLRQGDSIGTIAEGKTADLVLIHGDPSTKIEDLEKVETVFKNGVGFDSAKLIESVRGQVGIR